MTTCQLSHLNKESCLKTGYLQIEGEIIHAQYKAYLVFHINVI